MEDGLWEITTTVDMPGMPSRPFTHTTCLTKEKAVPQNGRVGMHDQGREDPGEHRYLDHSMQGGNEYG
jgi:hypothetical protein